MHTHEDILENIYIPENKEIKEAYKNAALEQSIIYNPNKKQIFNDEYIKKVAADPVKNNVPNYAFVSEFVKGLKPAGW